MTTRRSIMPPRRMPIIYQEDYFIQEEGDRKLAWLYTIANFVLFVVFLGMFGLVLYQKNNTQTMASPLFTSMFYWDTCTNSIGPVFAVTRIDSPDCTTNTELELLYNNSASCRQMPDSDGYQPIDRGFRPRESGWINHADCVVAFCLITATAHLIYGSLLVLCSARDAFLVRHILAGYHWLRWLEYACTAPLVAIPVVMNMGLVFRNEIICIWTLHVATMACGFFADVIGFTTQSPANLKSDANQHRATQPRISRQWGGQNVTPARILIIVPIAMGVLLQAVAWGIPLATFIELYPAFQDTIPPAIVPLVIGEVVAFMLFGIVYLLSWGCHGCTCWCGGRRMGEYSFLLLSLVAKLYLLIVASTSIWVETTKPTCS
jgi:hypothetical protein